MVINADELVKKIRKENTDAMAEFERQVDAALVEKYDGHRAIIEGAEVPSLRNPVREMVLERYRAAGWNVEYSNSQRGGVSYIFKKEVKPAVNLSDSGQAYSVGSCGGPYS